MEQNLTEVAMLYKAWAWFDANKKRVAWGAGIAAGVVLAVWFFVNQKEQKEIKAREAVANVLMQPRGANPADTIAALLRVANENSGSPAGAQALLLAAGSLFTDGKFADAQVQFDKFAREHRDSPCLGTALLGVAASLEAQNKTNEAFTAYKNLVERHPNDLVVPQAKLALGRMYEGQGKPELALQCFQEVARLGPNSAFGNEAGMRGEDLILKYPNLIPTVAPTVAPTALPKAPSQPTVQPPVQSAPKAAPATPPAGAQGSTPAKKSK
jgi:tetratricopeptide (TPR) repeat protein